MSMIIIACEGKLQENNLCTGITNTYKSSLSIIRIRTIPIEATVTKQALIEGWRELVDSHLWHP